MKGPRKLSDACPSCELPVWSNQPHSGKPVHHDGACGLAVALGKTLAKRIPAPYPSMSDHAPNCDLNNARDDPEKWWPAAVRLAKANAPISFGVGLRVIPCPECGGDDRENSRKAWRERHMLRTHWLKVSRGRTGSPSREEVAEVCRWLQRWEQSVDNYWLHFAGLLPSGLEAEVKGDA